MATATTWDISEELARKVLGVVDRGLVSGLGIAEPGRMCVEAAVSVSLSHRGGCLDGSQANPDP